eukprot:TRINITY_DN7_c0_g1_i1.p1 TRINITY_DN7_c0_g1~~TRINITY_DN7_c0_g1_i1.p1  ORF type:complete len:177 (+),score=37.19 TRINITY_DN7_c0_g1_i1:93-623(+)
MRNIVLLSLFVFVFLTFDITNVLSYQCSSGERCSCSCSRSSAQPDQNICKCQLATSLKSSQCSSSWMTNEVKAADSCCQNLCQGSTQSTTPTGYSTGSPSIDAQLNQPWLKQLLPMFLAQHSLAETVQILKSFGLISRRKRDLLDDSSSLQRKRAIRDALRYLVKKSVIEDLQDLI